MIHGKLLLYDYGKETKKGYPIKISFTEGTSKKTRYHNLKLYSSRKDWDFNKEEVKRSHKEYYYILEEIIESKLKLTKILKDARRKNYSIDKCISLFKQNEVSSDFFIYSDQYLEDLKKGIQRLPERKRKAILKTISQKKSALKHFKSFAGSVDVNYLDKRLLTKYVKHCELESKSNNGIHSYMTALRTMYNCAVTDGVTHDKKPFKGVMPKKERTKDKSIEASELILIRDAVIETGKQSSGGGLTDFRNYFLSMFYLGGLDFIDIANLQEKHIVNGRVKFERFKGGTSEIINNKIFPEVYEILKTYDCKPYLFPIHKFTYETVRKNMNTRFRDWFNSIGGESYISTKSARYTFINIAKEKGLNREVIMEITGHSRNDVHSIYEGGFSNKVRDEVHREIISISV
jgi:site-specific recombinase XerD